MKQLNIKSEWKNHRIMTCKKLLSYFFVGEEMRRIIERLSKVEKKIPKESPIVFIKEYIEDRSKILVKIGYTKKEETIICAGEKEVEGIIKKLEYNYHEVIVFDERGMLED